MTSDSHRLLTLCILLFSAGTASGQSNETLRVVETVWGFDGRVVQGQFAPLSILVDNLSDQPIEGVATLRSVAGMVNLVGGVANQPVFIGPNSRRWVQFYPYIFGSTTTWQFAVETPDERFRFDPLDQPRTLLDGNLFQSRNPSEEQSRMPVVILDQPGLATRAPTTVKHMPAEIFPPYATATNGLYAMFLDHVPDWETPRQEALMSWLRRGGRLYLLLNSNRQTLHFSAVMAPLNEPFAEFAVGNGKVRRMDIQRNELSEQMVNAAAEYSEFQIRDDVPENAAGVNRQFGMIPRKMSDSEVFGSLRELTQPDHAWWLIILLSMCYIGLIFPGCWILSKQRHRHYLTTYGSIAGLALTFSLLFLLIGRRGYGETTSQYSLAIATAEDPLHWNCFEYSTLFVTSGDRYRILDKDRQTLLASGAEEPVDASITSGNAAVFDTLIPPFASQALVSRRRVTLDDWGVSVASISQTGSELTELTLSFNDRFPVGEHVEYYCLSGQHVHFMGQPTSQKSISLVNRRDTLQQFCTLDSDTDVQLNFTIFGRPAVQPSESEDLVKACFSSGLKTMVGRSLIDDFVEDPSKFRLPDGQLRLLVWAPIPEAVNLSVSTDTRRDGRILYVLPLQVQSP